jgi:O-acetyl-ADP-ribose deacetylase (regulator of RNase III)
MDAQLLLSNGRCLRLQEGDLTRIAADAIANAANSALAGGGGVDGAIHRAAGPTVMQELHAIRESIGGRLAPGQAVATSAGRLSARYIFHAVGPVWRGGNANEAATLASCYRVCMTLAEQRALRTLAFPSISTGVYGYPVGEAARIALGEIRAFLLERARSLEQVTMVLWGAQSFAAYANALGELTRAA